MKDKSKKEELKVLLSALAVFGIVALFSGSAAAFMPEGKFDDGVIKEDVKEVIIEKRDDADIRHDIDLKREEEAKYLEMCGMKCGLSPPKKEIFREGDFSDALTLPALDQASIGVPMPRRIEVLSAPGGDVSFSDRPEDRSRTGNKEVLIPGIHDITFAVSDGEKVLTGAEALDLAVGKERFFEAGKFKEVTGPDGNTVFELCF